MNQRIVPISFTKIQFSKIYSFYGVGGKSWNLFSLGTCFQTKWKLLFHAPHSIASKKKTLTWDSAMTFSRKTFCCVWQQQRAKKTWNEAEEFDASFDCYFTQASPPVCFHTWEISMLFGKQTIWNGRQMTKLSEFLFLFKDGYFMVWLEKKRSVQSSIGTRRLVGGKSVFEEERNFSSRSEQTQSRPLSVWIEEQFELQRKVLCEMKTQVEATIMGWKWELHWTDIAARVVQISSHIYVCTVSPYSSYCETLVNFGKLCVHFLQLM